MKTQVYNIGRYLGVSADILSARSTNGLWEDDCKDESQIDAFYEDLEWAMNYEEGDKTQSLTDRKKEILDAYRQFNKANRHKMDPIPVCTIPQQLKA